MKHIDTNNSPRRVAAYIRVSTANASQKDSYESQKEYFSTLLASNSSWTNAGIFCDYGLSATSFRNRPGFLHLMQHCETGQIDRILCKSISRFARNICDLLITLQRLEIYNVSILFEKEGLDTATHDNQLILTLLGAIAQEESHTNSERQLWANQRRYRQGEIPNIPIYGYRYKEGTDAYETTEHGYRFRQVEIVESEASVVRYIFDEVISGKTYSAIAADLNLRHISPRHSPLWTADQIRGLIRKERYTGAVLAQKTYTADYLSHKVRNNYGARPQYYIQNHHPAIISEETFRQAHGRLPKNATSQKRILRPYSQFLICFECGRFFHVRKTSRDSVWRCPTNRLSPPAPVCRTPGISEQELYSLICRALTDRFTSRYRLLRNALLQLLNDYERREPENPDTAYQKICNKNYSYRVGARSWLSSLSPQTGDVATLLSGLRTYHVRAFILNITIDATGQYRFLWLDNIYTYSDGGK